MLNARRLATAAAVILAVGCGSSSKKSNPPAGGRTVTYSGSTATSALSASTNKTQVAGQATAVAKMMTGMSGTVGSFGAAAPAPRFTVKDALRVAADARHQAGGAAVSGAVQPQTHACQVSGTGTFTVNDQDGNPATVQAGDYVEIAYAACNDGRGEVQDGSIRLQFTTSGTDFVTDVTSITQNASFGLTLVAANMVTVDTATGAWNGMDGDITISYAANVTAGTLTYSISGASLEAAEGTGDTITDGLLLTGVTSGAGYSDVAVETFRGMGTPGAALTSESWDLDARMCTVSLGGCLNITTNPAFTITAPNAYPGSGSLTVSDGTDSITVTAVNGVTGAVNLTWNIDGTAGGPEATTWAALDAAAGVQ